MSYTRGVAALFLLGSLAWAAGACSSDGASNGGGAGSSDDAGTTGMPGADGGSSVGSDGGTSTANDGGNGDAGTVASGPPPSSLPVSYTRPDVGMPLSPAELATATDQLVALLVDTHYFDTVESRVHGLPESDPAHGYFFGTWWSGVTIEKKGGAITYHHAADGADNNPMRTAPYLEGSCYAHLMWGKPQTAHLVRTLVRGYSSASLGMQRKVNDEAILARSVFPPSILSTDNGRSIMLDYSLDRPGVDGNSLFVHLPANPTFGDIYVQNNRSKDDEGQVFRSIIQADACTPRLPAVSQTDVAQMKALYAAWSKQIEADNWAIATLDQSLNVTIAPATDTKSHYALIGNVECPGALMYRLAADGNPGTLDCGNGISSTESLTRGSLKSDALQILRTHHEAAVNWALATGQKTVALSLLQGLASRVETDLADATKASPPSNVNPDDIVTEVLHAANTGVPLTSQEVRFVLGHLATAYASYRAPAMAQTYAVFDAATPDGTYSYDIGAAGMFYSDIALLIGSCASPYRNPTGRPLVDCARLLAALK